jgi:hypothetical protein
MGSFIVALATARALTLVTPISTASRSGHMDNPPPGTASCTVKSDNPHGSKGTPGDMVSKARYGCNQDIDSMTAIVQLQQDVNGKWVVIQENQQTTQSPQANRTYTVQVAISCRSGVFRTASQGYGYYGGRPSRSTAWDYSLPMTNPCG